MDQTVAVAIVMGAFPPPRPPSPSLTKPVPAVAGLGLLLSSVLFIKRYQSRQRMLAAGAAARSSHHPSLLVSFSAQGQHPYGYFYSEGRVIPGVPLSDRGRTAGGGVTRLPERDLEGGEDLPAYGVAAKEPRVEPLLYPPAAYAPAGNGLPPPYEVEGSSAGRGGG